MAATSFSRSSPAASEIRVYIQDDNHDKENTEDQDNIEKISSEENVNSQELEETTQKKKRITKRSSGKKGNAARWNDLNSSPVPTSSRTIHTFYKFVSRDAYLVFTFLRRKRLEIAALVIFLARLPVKYRQLSRTSLAV